MTLAEEYVSLLKTGWSDVFADSRTHRRAVEHALAWPSAVGHRTISQDICMLGRSQRDWSADYKMYSRSPWDAEHLFGPVFDEYLDRYPKGSIAMPLDDTKVHKTGKHIPGASWQRDPLSPPFHVNFIWGMRFLQASLIFPHHQEGPFSARAFPIRFQHVPVVPKPRQAASADELKQYRIERRENNLSTAGLALIRSVRRSLDERGAADRQLLVPADASFCNRTFFKTPIPRVDLLARCRKDARLCFQRSPIPDANMPPRSSHPKTSCSRSDCRGNRPASTSAVNAASSSTKSWITCSGEAERQPGCCGWSLLPQSLTKCRFIPASITASPLTC